MTPEHQSIATQTTAQATTRAPRTNDPGGSPRRGARRARKNPAAVPRALPRAHGVGRWGEEVVSRILEANGYRIVDRNWRPPAGLEHEQIRGEIDIVAIDPDDELVFIEVKTRSTEDFGHPFAAIDRDKARRTRALAILWCRLRESLDFARFRIDAIAVTGTCKTFTFEHLKGVA